MDRLLWSTACRESWQFILNILILCSRCRQGYIYTSLGTDFPPWDTFQKKAIATVTNHFYITIINQTWFQGVFIFSYHGSILTNVVLYFKYFVFSTLFRKISLQLLFLKSGILWCFQQDNNCNCFKKQQKKAKKA